MLNSLTVKHDITTFSVSPENPTGEKGKGGMATEGSASEAARELGQGWKVNPYIVVDAETTAVLADVKGQGAIKHIWITDNTKACRLFLQSREKVPCDTSYINGFECIHFFFPVCVTHDVPPCILSLVLFSLVFLR